MLVVLKLNSGRIITVDAADFVGDWSLDIDKRPAPALVKESRLYLSTGCSSYNGVRYGLPREEV